MSDDLDAAKRELRSAVRLDRQARTLAERDAAAAGIATQLDALVRAYDARTIACYVSLPSEPGTAPFLRRSLAEGRRLLLPRSRTDGMLDWTPAIQGGEWETGRFGVPEPVGDRLPPEAAGDADLLVIPAAVVDRTGMRLGWGRGFYDRTLATMTHRPPVYAVIYDSDLVDLVPRDAHDQPVDGLVTPTRTLVFDPSARV